MTALVTRHATAEALVRTAWHDTDYLGDLLPHSIHYRRHIAEAIDHAADILMDAGFAEPDDDMRKRARLLLELETDEYLDRLDRERRDALADAVEAGDCDHDGNVIPWSRYP